MNYEKLINNLTPDIHASLKRAIELGKWPDGRSLTDDQKALCMEAVITYDNRRLNTDQRVGYIDRGSKSDGDVCDDTDEMSGADEPSPLKWS